MSDDETKSLEEVVSDASYAEQVMTEWLKKLAVKRFTNWFDERAIMDWLLQDPLYGYFVLTNSQPFTNDSTSLEERLGENAKKFQERITTMSAEEIFTLLSDLNKAEVRTIVLKYGLF